MSGGTIQPIGARFSIEEMAESIRENSDDAWHLVFANHLDKIAKALAALDKELSGDTEPGDAREEIRACLNDSDLLAYEKLFHTAITEQKNEDVD